MARCERRCSDCDHLITQDADESCKMEHKMTFEQFEDYFVDRVLPCKFYKRKEVSNVSNHT